MIDANTAAVLAQFGVDAAMLEYLLPLAAGITVLTLVTVIPTGVVASSKGRSRAFWMMLALSFPVLPLLVVWLLPSVKSVKHRPPAG